MVRHTPTGRKRIFADIAVLFLVIYCMASAQVPVDPESAGDGFYLISFSDYRVDLERDSTVYEQDKLIFGFRSQIHTNLSARVGIDFYRPNEDDARQFTPYLKPAVLTYSRQALTLDFGIFYTSQFDQQRSYWGHRYISRTLHNKYHFGYSSDLGIRAKYVINRFFAVDAALVNGDGYKYVKVASPLKLASALYLTPADGVTIKAYYESFAKM